MRIKLLLLFLIYSGFCFSQNVIEATIYFEIDRYDLNEEEASKVAAILNQISAYEKKQIYLSGHTDSDGSTAYNQKLSERRVNAIRDLFLKGGFQIEAPKVKSKGELNPILRNNSKENKQRNRRVEIVINYEENENTTSKKDENTAYGAVETQHFDFLGLEGIERVGKEGTIVKINPNTIVNAAGIVIEGKMTLELKEYYLTSDMLLGGLQTLSVGDTLLETAGMVHVKVYRNGVAVKLKDGATFDISVLNKKRLKMMYLFGKEDNESKWSKREDYMYEPHMRDIVLEKYLFSSSKFGWINSDRFLELDELTEMHVRVNDTINTSLCMVFKNINALLNASKGNDSFLFRKIPVGKTVSIIAFKLKEGKFLYAQKNVTIRKNARYKLKLNEISESLFNQLIEQFN